MTESYRRRPETRRDTEMRSAWSRSLIFPKGCRYADGCEQISEMLLEFDAFLAQVPGLEQAGANDLRLVCDELVANVLRHVSVEKDATVEIGLQSRTDRVVLRIRDNGEDFDCFNQPTPYLGSDLDARRVGGLGLYLIKQLFPNGCHKREDGWNVSQVEYCMGEEGRLLMGREN